MPIHRMPAVARGWSETSGLSLTEKDGSIATQYMITSTETEDIQGVRKASYMCGISVVQCTDRYASGGSALRDRKGSTSRNTRLMQYVGVHVRTTTHSNKYGNDGRLTRNKHR